MKNGLKVVLVCWLALWSQILFADDARTARAYAEQRWITAGRPMSQELRFERIDEERAVSASLLNGSGRAFRVTFSNAGAAIAGQDRFEYVVLVEDGQAMGIGSEEEAVNLLAENPVTVTTAAQAAERLALFARLMCLPPPPAGRGPLPVLKDGFWTIRQTFKLDPFAGTRITYDLRVTPEGAVRIDGLSRSGTGGYD